MNRNFNRHELIPDSLYWVKMSNQWNICKYISHDYADGADSYFFDLEKFVMIRNFELIHRVVEIKEPDDVV